jgi:DNA-binding LacI/PurR family transcriptional regulator
VRKGWLGTLRLLGLPTDVATMDGIHFDAPGGERAMNEALRLCKATGTTAVIVLSDPQALALEQHSLDRGIRVPHDLAIVAYDDEVARFGDPAITAVRPPKHYVGREAVNLLIARLEAGQGRPTHRVKLTPELHVRDSSLPTTISRGEADAAPRTDEDVTA